MEELQKEKIFFGVSITLTSKNFCNVMRDSFINTLRKKGANIIGFVEYVPVDETSLHLSLTKALKDEKKVILSRYRSNSACLFIDLPDDEEQFGGCLSAGKGFVHISSEGFIEPCPFSPIADLNIKNCSLKEGLRSRVLQIIRENKELFKNHQSGCTLWDNKEEVKKLIKIEHS